LPSQEQLMQDWFVKKKVVKERKRGERASVAT
jgi:hypothetical protein